MNDITATPRSWRRSPPRRGGGEVAGGRRTTLVKVAADRPASGAGWIGLRDNGAYRVTAVTDIPLFASLLALEGCCWARCHVVSRRPLRPWHGVGRQHHARGALKRAWNEFAIEKTVGIEGPGSAGGRVAASGSRPSRNTAHRPPRARGRAPAPAPDQVLRASAQPNPEVLPLRMNRERSEQQGGRSRLADAQRPEADGTGKPSSASRTSMDRPEWVNCPRAGDMTSWCAGRCRNWHRAALHGSEVRIVLVFEDKGSGHGCGLSEGVGFSRRSGCVVQA